MVGVKNQMAGSGKMVEAVAGLKKAVDAEKEQLIQRN
jgi:hypothetical protein